MRRAKRNMQGRGMQAPPLIVGVDPALRHFAVVAVERGVIRFALVASTEARDGEVKRLFQLTDCYVRFLQAVMPVAAVGVEELAFAKRSRSVSVMGKLAGVVCASTYLVGLPCCFVPIQTWKKRFGKANASARDLRLQSSVELPPFKEAWLDDVFSAYGVARSVERADVRPVDVESSCIPTMSQAVLF